MSDYAKKHIRFFLAICVGMVCFSSKLSAENAVKDAASFINPSSLRAKIYFYNPEINTARNLVLKSTWDNYLHHGSDFEFQPVDDKAEFIRLIKTQDNTAFIMAEWFYASLPTDSPYQNQLKLAFQGFRNNNDTYTKILVANTAAPDFDNVTIACSGSKARAKEILSSIYPRLSPAQLDNLNILLVPKDIDALMAVGYGLADMALSTERSLSKMSTLNQSLFKDMLVLRESKPFKRSVLVVKSTDSDFKRRLALSMLNMTNSMNGIRAMSLLGLDEWRAKASVPSVLSVNASNFSHSIKPLDSKMNYDETTQGGQVNEN